MNYKKIITILTLVLLVLIAVIIALMTFKVQTILNSDPGIKQEALVGNDRDQHDCLGSAGYSWCASQNKCLRVFEEFCPDLIKELVSKIKQQTGVNLAGPREAEFDWLANQDGDTLKIKISGVNYSSPSVKRADYNSVEKHLNDNFTADIYNMADGVQGGLRGYNGSYFVCALNFQYEKMQENSYGLLEPAEDSLQVALNCGFFNKNQVSNLFLIKRFQEILAKKYKKSITEVNVKIIKQDENHVAGSVIFGSGGQAEGGLFLAVKQGEYWIMVYDGNGSVDCQRLREKYNFSDDLLSPNFCDPQTRTD